MENKVVLLPEEMEEEIPKRVFTIDDLRRQYGYELATDLLHQMLELGIITQGEFTKIDAKNRKSFSPHLPELLPNYA